MGAGAASRTVWQGAQKVFGKAQADAGVALWEQSTGAALSRAPQFGHMLPRNADHDVCDGDNRRLKGRQRTA